MGKVELLRQELDHIEDLLGLTKYEYLSGWILRLPTFKEINKDLQLAGLLPVLY